VKEVTQWWAEFGAADTPWLILGKGPSLERKDEFDLAPFTILALNHVARDMAVDVASVMDMDVIAQCGVDIERNARYVLMPRYPHVACKPARRTLDTFLSEHPVLEKLSAEGRLIWYNYDADREPDPTSPVIPSGYFSGEVMVNLLATLGVKKIRTLGIDGGNTYSAKFDPADRFANRQSSFDLQWSGIISTVEKHGIDFAPLTTELPVRVFVGTDESQLIGAKVLEHTIRKHCPVAVEVDYMLHVKTRMPKDHKNRPRTEFSFARYAIPKLCGYQGKGIYLDADMQVFRNFLELWDIPFDGATVLRAPSSNPSKWPNQFSVLLLDCSRLQWDVEEIIQGLDDERYDYDELLKQMCVVPPDQIKAAIPREWNSLEEYHPGRTGLVHYTNMITQPWVNRRNPIGDIWVQGLCDAIDDGFVTVEELEEAVGFGYARPSLPWQLKFDRKYWWLFRKVVAPFLDFGFRPHKALRTRLKKKYRAPEESHEPRAAANR
jgi:hypothetical protein